MNHIDLKKESLALERDFWAWGDNQTLSSKKQKRPRTSLKCHPRKKKKNPRGSLDITWREAINDGKKPHETSDRKEDAGKREVLLTS